MLRLLKFIQLMCNENKLLIIENNQMNRYMQNTFLLYQKIHSDIYSKNGFESEEKKVKKKTPRIPKIKLIHTDQSVTVTLLEEAHKLAKRRNLQLILVKEGDSEINKSVYKLLSPTQLSEISNENVTVIETKTRKKKVKTKSFVINNDISDHDLKIKMNNINRVLKMQYKAKIILICSSNNQKELLQRIKNMIQGTASDEIIRKDRVIVTFSPLLNDANNSLNNINNPNVP